MGWSKLVDLELDDETVLDTCCSVPALPKPKGPQYPWGLRITLNKEQLDKLGLDANCNVGDVIDMRAFAEVTSVSKEGDNVRVELQIQKLAVEDEMSEDEADEE